MRTVGRENPYRLSAILISTILITCRGNHHCLCQTIINLLKVFYLDYDTTRSSYRPDGFDHSKTVKGGSLKSSLAIGNNMFCRAATTLILIPPLVITENCLLLLSGLPSLNCRWCLVLHFITITSRTKSFSQGVNSEVFRGLVETTWMSGIVSTKKLLIGEY